MEVLNNNEIIEMFDKLGLSIAVFDRDMKMIYMNERAKWFYSKVFKAENILGKSVKDCHAEINIKNINNLFETFDNGKPLSFFHADPPMIEGGQISVIHYPYIVDGKVEGIMEINIESSLQDSGRGKYERKFN
ncbi:MAG: PAS domain-containing protein [Erysipelotrichaceae bacterium]|nr:PAS domain-containing protein [Erysipelotrichaceae bacterium]